MRYWLRPFLIYAADDQGGFNGGSQGTTASTAGGGDSSAGDASVATGTGGAAGADGAGGSGASGAAQAASVAAAVTGLPDSHVGFRDTLTRIAPHFRVPENLDDEGVLNHILLGYQQGLAYRQRAEQLDQIMPQWSEFQKWQAQQQQAARAQQAQQANQPWYANFWKPPEYDPQWERFIVRGEDGSLRALPGADPSLPAKYLAYHEFRRQQMDQFMQNPHEFMRPTVEAIAQAVAQQAINQNLGQYQAQSFANDYLRNNNWLFQRDAQGNTVRDPATGAELLSEAGQLMHRYVNHFAQAGIADPVARQQAAQAMVERDLAVARLNQLNGQTQQQTQSDQQKQQFLQQAGAAGAVRGGPGNNQQGQGRQNAAPVRQARVRLFDRMMADMEAAGFHRGDIPPDTRTA